MMLNEKGIMRMLIGSLLLTFLIWIGCVGAIAYVLIHFITKYW